VHPGKLKVQFAGYECQTVLEAGLAERKNGFLLDIAARTGFEILVTMDKGLESSRTLRAGAS
jgi:hypothetical protein